MSKTVISTLPSLHQIKKIDRKTDSGRIQSYAIGSEHFPNKTKITVSDTFSNSPVKNCLRKVKKSYEKWSPLNQKSYATTYQNRWKSLFFKDFEDFEGNWILHGGNAVGGAGVGEGDPPPPQWGSSSPLWRVRVIETLHVHVCTPMQWKKQIIRYHSY